MPQISLKYECNTNSKNIPPYNLLQINGLGGNSPTLDIKVGSTDQHGRIYEISTFDFKSECTTIAHQFVYNHYLPSNLVIDVLTYLNFIQHSPLSKILQAVDVYFIIAERKVWLCNCVTTAQPCGSYEFLQSVPQSVSPSNAEIATASPVVKHPKWMVKLHTAS